MPERNRNESVYQARKIGLGHLEDIELELRKENRAILSSIIYPLYRKTNNTITFKSLTYNYTPLNYSAEVYKRLAQALLINAVCLERVLSLDLMEFASNPYKLVTLDQSPEYVDLKEKCKLTRVTPSFDATDASLVVNGLDNCIKNTIAQLLNFLPYFNQMKNDKVNNLGFVVPIEKQDNFEEGQLVDVKTKVKSTIKNLSDLRKKLLNNELKNTQITITNKDGSLSTKTLTYPEIMLMIIENGRISSPKTSSPSGITPQ